uniref:Centrosomal protein of 19 kDa n=1 Tax=Tetraselmis chuii TaxID=63592 RepID=A0A7S1SUS5_9CHLO|mmetsp:Transcript_26721/g.47561  ORF Transcript_26721/g.47561 Transcript_26721/m.47561 type:complete len:216 (+) Transcript_26721:281-928(+)|eukprot:CAMPEP_0177770314 /NCGR_PEP_ID=MMETSP0491_2-20121128/10852_1 /TAXON_ID=63592 /ORGANISM="Tetraselmis chuii, Strain PLY429" /LENGTH=215 /DNA_ID=CAMNT_0019287507 /DNA_START=394 /DNA_END=1041 /DNA_ORIENTATION=+
MSALCKARRYAIKYDPPTIILEYETPAKEKRLRSVKVQDIQQDADVDRLTKKIIQSFPRKLDRRSVSSEQVRRLVVKLVQSLQGAHTVSQPLALPKAKVGKLQPLNLNGTEPKGRSPVVATKHVQPANGESFGMSVDSIADAEMDLNKLSDQELSALKAAMDVDFNKNRVALDDPEFKYDVQKEFVPTEDNDWDDDDDDSLDGSNGGDDDFEWPT